MEYNEILKYFPREIRQAISIELNDNKNYTSGALGVQRSDKYPA